MRAQAQRGEEVWTVWDVWEDPLGENPLGESFTGLGGDDANTGATGA